jgi:hypothetical protein
LSSTTFFMASQSRVFAKHPSPLVSDLLRQSMRCCKQERKIVQLSPEIRLHARHGTHCSPAISFDSSNSSFLCNTLLHSRARKSMYHHANTNINSQSPDHASIFTRSSETRRRQIPLAFENTEWGREYIANPNWEQENLEKSNANVRQGSRSQPHSNDKSIPASIPSHDASTVVSANASADSHSSSASVTTPPSISPAPTQSSQQYSVMVAWNFFCRTLPQSNPTSSDTPDTDNINLVHPEQEEHIKLGPWLEMLMRWDDYEQWQIKLITYPDASDPSQEDE